MNSNAIDRMTLRSESSSGNRKYVGKIAKNGAKRRRYEEYVLKESNYVRNKQTKVRYDTQRRTEMPDEEDAKLENLHFANFLGDRYGDNNSAYNHPACTISIKMCDSMREQEEEEELQEAKNRRFQAQQRQLRALKRAIEEGFVSERSSVKKRRAAKTEVQKRNREDEDVTEMPAAKRRRV
jgi:hypothetical protein